MPRLKLRSKGGSSYYHCVSRVVDRREVLDASAKNEFLRLMREYEEFCEVRILTYCLMPNHFHILVEVPQTPEELPSAERILEKLAKLTGLNGHEPAREELASLRNNKDVEGEGRWLSRYRARMWDISAFMKLLKQRFTQWFNATHQRCGTLWEGRFKSVLVEGTTSALVAMASYIDMNPVRGGLEVDPEDYIWSGFGEASRGGKKAQLGLRRVLECQKSSAQLRDTKVVPAYAACLAPSDKTPKISRNSEMPYSSEMKKRSHLLDALRRKTMLPMSDYIRCKVRYFCDGVVFGGRNFVDTVFLNHRPRFGKRRKSGARKLRGLEGGDLFALRDLRVRLFD